MSSTLPRQTNRKVDEQSTGKVSRPRWLVVAVVVAAGGCRSVVGVCLDSLGLLLAGAVCVKPVQIDIVPSLVSSMV